MFYHSGDPGSPGAPPVENEEGPLASASVAHGVVELQYVSVYSPGSGRQVGEERDALDRCSLLQSLEFRPWLGCGPLHVKVEVRSAPGLPQVPDSGVGGQCFHPSCHLGMSLAIWRCRWHRAPSCVLMVDPLRGHEWVQGYLGCREGPCVVADLSVASELTLYSGTV